MVGSPAPRKKRDFPAYYLKFDLNKSAIGEIPDLLDFYKATGAIRVCVIFKTHGAWDRVPLLPVTYVEDTSWHTIKIPSIDGTELWIMPGSKQAEVELKMGFGKPSVPLLSTPAKAIQAISFRDPLFRSEVHFRWKNDVICTSITGATLLSPTADWTLEQMESLKDLGSFAFEE